MRVVTAQLPPSTRTGPQSQATTLGAIRSHPLPSGGSREVNLHRLATSGYLSDLSDLPSYCSITSDSRALATSLTSSSYFFVNS